MPASDEKTTEKVAVQVVDQMVVDVDKDKNKVDFKEIGSVSVNDRSVGDAVVTERASTKTILPFTSSHPWVVMVSKTMHVLLQRKLHKTKIDQNISVKSGETKLQMMIIKFVSRLMPFLFDRLFCFRKITFLGYFTVNEQQLKTKDVSTIINGQNGRNAACLSGCIA